MGWVTNTGSELPSIRYYACSCTYDSKIYIAGGYTGTVYLNSVISYDPNNSYDTTLDTMADARSKHTSGLYGSTIIVAGGTNTSVLKSCEKYDIDTDAWSSIADMPEVHQKGTGTICRDDFYVIGGSTDKIYRYDISEDTWSTLVTGIGVGDYPVVIPEDRYIWIIGGKTNKTAVRKFNTFSNDFVSAGAYTNAPSDVNRSSAVAHGAKIYIAGGYTSSASNNFISYDTSNNTWDSGLDAMPTAKYSAGIGIVDRTVYILGGYSGSGGLDVNESYELPPTNPGGDINPFRTRVSQ